MKNADILKRVDLTLLKADTNLGAVFSLCETALRWGTASVCIPPSFVKAVREAFPSLRITTVAGFPLGYQTAAVKAYEIADAAANGADEIDIVTDIGDIKTRHTEKIAADLDLFVQSAGNAVLKLIFETCYLDDREKTELIELADRACGFSYIKTSTGFGTRGAEINDMLLFKSEISRLGSKLKIKAAGGIRTKEDFVSFVNAGADRIGASDISSLIDKTRSEGSKL